MCKYGGVFMGTTLLQEQGRSLRPPVCRPDVGSLRIGSAAKSQRVVEVHIPHIPRHRSLPVQVGRDCGHVGESLIECSGAHAAIGCNAVTKSYAIQPMRKMTELVCDNIERVAQMHARARTAWKPGSKLNDLGSTIEQVICVLLCARLL